jgi:hypothetical protein
MQTLAQHLGLIMNTQSADALLRPLQAAETERNNEVPFNEVTDEDLKNLIIHLSVLVRSGQDTTELKARIDSWPKDFFYRVSETVFNNYSANNAFWIRPAETIISCLKK